MFAKPLTLLFFCCFGILMVLQVIKRKLWFEGGKCKEVEVLWKSDQVHGVTIESIYARAHASTRLSARLQCGRTDEVPSMLERT
jgi:hypothetical protein